MSKTPFKQLLTRMGFGRRIRLLKTDDSYKKSSYILNRFQWSKADGDVPEGKNVIDKLENKPTTCDSSDDELSGYNNKWKPEIAWRKALEPALQLYKWAVPTGIDIDGKWLPTDRIPPEIFSSLQRIKLGFQDWSLSDLTIGLYLIYLRQASTNAVEDVKGELITSESIVQDLIYHIELAKGAYKGSAAGLARNSLLREKNVVKFENRSSVSRPGYYIGTDMRKKLVILGIRGTHTVNDLITDLINTGHGETTFDGYSTHFGTAEAARWFLKNELDTIRMCLEKHKGFRLRLVGHSLGGATASLLAIMIRKKSFEELGFKPDIVTAVTYATPPWVSKELAESCSDYVTTVVMQDDIIPRLNATTLTRLRNEILETDWLDVISKEDWKRVIDIVDNAKQVVTSVRDVARKLAEYAKFRGETKYPEIPTEEKAPPVPSLSRTLSPDQPKLVKLNGEVVEELFVPGAIYFLKRNVDTERFDKRNEYFTLLRRHPGEHFQRILLSGNIISDHKCDSHFYALRDVLKGLPSSLDDRTIG